MCSRLLPIFLSLLLVAQTAPVHSISPRGQFVSRTTYHVFDSQALAFTGGALYANPLSSWPLMERGLLGMRSDTTAAGSFREKWNEYLALSPAQRDSPAGVDLWLQICGIVRKDVPDQEKGPFKIFLRIHLYTQFTKIRKDWVIIRNLVYLEMNKSGDHWTIVWNRLHDEIAEIDPEWADLDLRNGLEDFQMPAAGVLYLRLSETVVNVADQLAWEYASHTSVFWLGVWSNNPLTLARARPILHARAVYWMDMMLKRFCAIWEKTELNKRRMGDMARTLDSWNEAQKHALSAYFGLHGNSNVEELKAFGLLGMDGGVLTRSHHSSRHEMDSARKFDAYRAKLHSLPWWTRFSRKGMAARYRTMMAFIVSMRVQDDPIEIIPFSDFLLGIRDYSPVDKFDPFLTYPQSMLAKLRIQFAALGEGAVQNFVGAHTRVYWLGRWRTNRLVLRFLHWILRQRVRRWIDAMLWEYTTTWLRFASWGAPHWGSTFWQVLHPDLKGDEIAILAENEDRRMQAATNARDVLVKLLGEGNIVALRHFLPLAFIPAKRLVNTSGASDPRAVRTSS